MRIQHADVVYEVHTDLKMAARLLATLTSLLDDLLEDWFPAIGTRFVHLSEGSLLVDRLVPCNVCASEAILAEKGRWTLKNEARAIHHRFTF